jgi:predicted nucleic acid-binding protein
MTNFLLDSGIIIQHLRKRNKYSLLDELAVQGRLFISTMTRFEILRGIRERERSDTAETLEALENFPIDNAVADLAGELVRAWRAKGVTLGDADVLIATTAIHNGLALVTTKPRHFPIPDLTVYQTDETGKMTRWTTPPANS